MNSQNILLWENHGYNPYDVFLALLKSRRKKFSFIEFLWVLCPAWDYIIFVASGVPFLKKLDFLTADRCISWGIIAAGATLAVMMFFYATSVPIHSRLRGDAFEYMVIASGFSSVSDAFAYVGYRTYGFPLFLYTIKAVASPAGPDDWVAIASYYQFILHLCACAFFYAAFLKGIFQKAGLPRITAPAVAAALMAYPALVTYTTIPLTDTFCADLLMLAAAAYSAGRSAARRTALILCCICGLLLGYAVMVRPSFGVAVAAFYCALFLGFIADQKWRSQIIGTALMTAATLVLILPTMKSVWDEYGSVGLQDKAFVERSGLSMQIGLSSVRVYWSGKYVSYDAAPGIRDPYLEKTYREKCAVDSVASLTACLLSEPQALPLYFGKKALALFDVPHLQPYAVDLTPAWFVPLERIFGVAAFCGFISLFIMAGSHLLQHSSKHTWIGLPWAALVLTLMLLHTLLHVEGRYGLPAVPFSIPSLFLGFAAARQAGRRFFGWWFLAISVSAACFVYQVNNWDSVTPS